MVASNIDEKTLKKEGVCAASLPTTMGIVAGFLVQNTLKYLLRFGNVTHYLGYNALQDFFPTYGMKPNPTCDDSFCIKQQKVFASTPKDTLKEPVQEEESVVHESNEWDISVIDETAEEAENLQVAEGLALSYSRPAESVTVDDSVNNQVSTGDNVSLQDLMQQMKNL